MLLGILFLIVLVQGVFAEESCNMVRMWGLYENGSSTTANGIAIDSDDNIYVTDPDNNRIREFSSSGSLITFWNLRESEYQQSAIPNRIAVDSAGNVYSTDSKNNTVMKFTTYRSQVWGSEGTGDGQFSHPTGIAVDSSGNVYVADTNNNRIQKFHSTGMYLLQWGSYGTADGAFNAPEGITVDASGLVYVTDTGNKRIQKFSSDGTFLTKWGSGGTGGGQFSTPTGIAADSWGNIYVADLTSRVQKFSPTGEYFTACNTGGDTHDIAIDSSGYLYALWQSGPAGTIGKYGTPMVIPTQIPGQSHTFALETMQTNAVTTTSKIPTRTQNSTLPAIPPVTPATILTTAPTASPVTIVSPALAPGYLNEEKIQKTDVQTEILDRVSRFFREVLGVDINFSARVDRRNF